jgi:Raf kinase inhibitor-like YbhB/YbcL family protein
MSYDPYASAFPAPSFAVHSKDFADGGALPGSAYQPASESPALSWPQLPAGTRSLVVTAFDADAPIPGGLWHWAVKDVPASAAGLEHGDASLGEVLANSLGRREYTGVKPPSGTGTHRLFVCVTALSVETLPLAPDASLAMLHVAMVPHTLGRGIIVGTSTPAGPGI